jgi:hypothetical protein
MQRDATSQCVLGATSIAVGSKGPKVARPRVGDGALGQSAHHPEKLVKPYLGNIGLAIGRLSPPEVVVAGSFGLEVALTRTTFRARVEDRSPSR